MEGCAAATQPISVFGWGTCPGSTNQLPTGRGRPQLHLPTGLCGGCLPEHGCCWVGVPSLPGFQASFTKLPCARPGSAGVPACPGMRGGGGRWP